MLVVSVGGSPSPRSRSGVLLERSRDWLQQRGVEVVTFQVREFPAEDLLHARFGACAGALERYEETFRGPSLPAGDAATAEERRLAARDLADELGLPIGNAVDFWTEASLFSQTGLTAFVYGPGDIAQAHTADEWVALDQLQQYTESVTRILQGAT